MRLLGRIHGATVCLALSALCAEAEAQTVVEGRIVRLDGSAVAGAEITVGGTLLSARSDSGGRFSLEGIPPGPTRFQARALGFAPLDTTITLRAGQPRSVTLRMTQNVQQLAPVVTEAALPYGKPERYRHTGRFDDFYERRAKRAGVFLTREDIENSGRNTVMELMSGAPGVRVSFHGGRESIRIPRCVGSSIYMSQKGDDPDRPTALKPPTRWLAVYIDGQRIGADPINALSQLKAEDVETVEFYRGPSQLPMEAVGDACAAVFVTTRFTAGSVLPKK